MRRFETRIDEKGRIIVPKELRNLAELKSGTRFLVAYEYAGKEIHLTLISARLEPIR